MFREGQIGSGGLDWDRVDGEVGGGGGVEVRGSGNTRQEKYVCLL